MKPHRKWVDLVRRWWTVLLVGVLVLVWALQNADLQQLPFVADPVWSQVQRSGILRVGTDASYPPLADVTEDGVFEGLDIDLGRALAREMGVEAQFVNIHWDGLFDALHAGKVDVVISAVPYDGTLTRDLDYSAPYADLGLVLVARRGVAYEPTLAGERVGVELGSNAHLYARQRARSVTDLELVVVNSTADLTSLLAEGEIDIVICDRITAGELTAMPDMEMILPPLSSEPVHVVTARSAGKLATDIDAALAGIEANGELATMVSHWLGGTQ